ncbi:MAG: VanZ family protein [Rubrivivax sp.]|jgi:VanZ family protein|nr:VanZ family protein [Rubrivivax sp.]
MPVSPAPELHRPRTVSDHVRVALFSSPARRGWAVAMAVTAAVVAVKALSVSPPGPAFAWDKINHVAAFTALAFCGLFTFRATARPHFWVSFILLAFGVAIELAQLYVPGRWGDVEDVVADAVGIVLGLMLAHRVAHWMDRRHRPRREEIMARSGGATRH